MLGQQLNKKMKTADKNFDMREDIRAHRKNLKNQLFKAMKTKGIGKSENQRTDDYISISPFQNAENKMTGIQSLPNKESQNGIQFNEDPLDFYELKEKIGFGSQSTVHTCVDKSSGKKYAMKVLTKCGAQIIQATIDSYSLVKKLDHPNIMKNQKLYIQPTKGKCQIISDIYDFYDLKHFIKAQKAQEIHTPQLTVSKIIGQLMKALDYMKKKKICHRDLKPQNILYNPQSGEVKIIDFEIARASSSPDQDLDLWTDTGSIYYRAPESFRGGYDERVDVWAVGVIAYELITGHLPFYSEYRNTMKNNICNSLIDFTKVSASDSFINLLRSLLEKDPNTRITPEQAIDIIFSKNHLDDQTEPGTPITNLDQVFSF